MKIYTSYYANMRNIDQSKYKLISVSKFMPQGIDMPKFAILCPDLELLRRYKNHEINEDGYRREYITNQLNFINKLNVVNFLLQISEGKDIVFMCYEAPGKFCHRGILTEWLDDTGLAGGELPVDTQKVNCFSMVQGVTKFNDK